MPNLPYVPSPGDPISAGWARQVVDYLRAITPRSGLSVRAVPAGLNGTSFETIGDDFTPTVTPNPFALIDPGDGSIRVVYGIVKGASDGMAPTGMSEGDTPPYILPADGLVDTGYVYLEVTSDLASNLTSVSIATASTIPDDSITDEVATCYLEIGSYDNTGDTLQLAQAISGSQAFVLCGGVTPEWGLM